MAEELTKEQLKQAMSAAIEAGNMSDLQKLSNMFTKLEKREEAEALNQRIDNVVRDAVQAALLGVRNAVMEVVGGECHVTVTAHFSPEFATRAVGVAVKRGGKPARGGRSGGGGGRNVYVMPGGERHESAGAFIEALVVDPPDGLSIETLEWLNGRAERARAKKNEAGHIARSISNRLDKEVGYTVAVEKTSA